MKKHGAIINTTSRIIRLNSSTSGPMDVHLSRYEIPESTVYHLEGKHLEGILVVCEYSDVFPAELPGMPLDRDVEFVIELQPGTSPISRRPYKMTPS